jgi:hypothetical protein
MTSKLSKLLSMSLPEMRLLLVAALLLPFVAAGIRFGGTLRLCRWFRQARGGMRIRHSPVVVARIVNVAASHLPFSAGCLARSLLLHRLLARQGTASTLRIGVRLAGGRLEAHAWVECDGTPVNDTEDVSLRYAPFEGSLSGMPFPAP